MCVCGVCVNVWVRNDYKPRAQRNALRVPRRLGVAMGADAAMRRGDGSRRSDASWLPAHTAVMSRGALPGSQLRGDERDGEGTQAHTHTHISSLPSPDAFPLYSFLGRVQPR
jgi:hypothetical protein